MTKREQTVEQIIMHPGIPDGIKELLLEFATSGDVNLNGVDLCTINTDGSQFNTSTLNLQPHVWITHMLRTRGIDPDHYMTTVHAAGVYTEQNADQPLSRVGSREVYLSNTDYVYLNAIGAPKTYRVYYHDYALSPDSCRLDFLPRDAHAFTGTIDFWSIIVPHGGGDIRGVTTEGHGFNQVLDRACITHHQVVGMRWYNHVTGESLLRRGTQGNLVVEHKSDDRSSERRRTAAAVAAADAAAAANAAAASAAADASAAAAAAARSRSRPRSRSRSRSRPRSRSRSRSRRGPRNSRQSRSRSRGRPRALRSRSQ